MAQDPKVIKILIGNLKIEERGAALFCAEALNKQNIQSKEKKIISKIYIEYLGKTGNDNVAIRILTAEGLGLLGERESIPHLLKSMESDENEIVRGSSALSLGRIGGNDIIKNIETAIKDQSEYVRGCAIYSLGRISKDKKIKLDLDLIKYKYENDSSNLVKLFSAAILIEYGEDKNNNYLKFIENLSENSLEDKTKEVAVKLLKKYKK